MHRVINQIQILSCCFSCESPCESLVQVLKGTLFISSSSDMLVWFQKGGFLAMLSMIRAHDQINPELKNFLFLSGILISLGNKLMTAIPALLKGLFL